MHSGQQCIYNESNWRRLTNNYHSIPLQAYDFTSISTIYRHQHQRNHLCSKIKLTLSINGHKQLLTHTETRDGNFFGVMNHTILQKYRIQSSKKTNVLLAKLCLFFQETVIKVSNSKVYRQQRQQRYCSNKLRLEWGLFLSARGSELRTVLMWTSVWSGNLLSSEVISLTHCIVKWWGVQAVKMGSRDLDL